MAFWAWRSDSPSPPPVPLAFPGVEPSHSTSINRRTEQASSRPLCLRPGVDLPFLDGLPMASTSTGRSAVARLVAGAVVAAATLGVALSSSNGSRSCQFFGVPVSSCCQDLRRSVVQWTGRLLSVAGQLRGLPSSRWHEPRGARWSRRRPHSAAATSRFQGAILARSPSGSRPDRCLSVPRTWNLNPDGSDPSRNRRDLRGLVVAVAGWCAAVVGGVVGCRCLVAELVFSHRGQTRMRNGPIPTFSPTG